VPFWTKRNPDYGSKMKTINCRDDSLIEDRGMWTTMKKKKRCIVVAQGFYEWLKKGSQRVPHFTRRKDGQLMCLAGLWDMVQFEGERTALSGSICPRPLRLATVVLHAAPPRRDTRHDYHTLDTSHPERDGFCRRASSSRFSAGVPRFPYLVRLPWPD
jgi:putative SOS response-associated peptidase YedK